MQLLLVGILLVTLVIDENRICSHGDNETLERVWRFWAKERDTGTQANILKSETRTKLSYGDKKGPWKVFGVLGLRREKLVHWQTS